MALVNFSEEELRLMRDMTAWYKKTFQNDKLESLPQGLPQTPDLYVARIIEDVDPLVTGSGTSVDSAVCDIYQIVPKLPSGHTLQKIENRVTVFNVDEGGLATDDWLPVIRDKFGYWIALTGGGTTIGSSIIYRPFEICDGIGFACDCVKATVITSSCGSSVNIGDVVNVWDIGCGWLNLPEPLLYASTGHAHYVKIHESDYNRPPGLTGVCRWVAMGPCCVEESAYGY